MKHSTTPNIVTQIFPRPRWLGTTVLLVLTTLVTDAGAQCTGDCGGNNEVTVDEIIVGVNIALGAAPLSACTAFDVDGNSEVTVNELIGAVSNALNGCPAGSTPTPTASPTVTSTPTDTPTATPTLPAPATPTPTVTAPPGCGDGVVDFVGGETCDDGNTTDGDECPRTCRIAACVSAPSTLDLTVSFTPPAGVDLAGLTVFVRYPEATVRIPGRANEAAVQDRIGNLPDNTFSTPNDLDYALRVVVFSPDSSPIPAGRLFTVQFDTCEGTTLPQAGEFHCHVESAADTSNTPVADAMCAVALP